jgi:hypothetical protein
MATSEAAIAIATARETRSGISRGRSMLEGRDSIVPWLFAELDGGTAARTTAAGLSDISPLVRPLLSARNGHGEIERAFIDIPLYAGARIRAEAVYVIP